MGSVLESIEWGKSSIQFADKISKHIDHERSAIIYLRHSQADYTKVKSPKDGELTEQGIKTSHEFGKKLPSQHKYKIYHSTYPRAKKSAENIHQGLITNNNESEIGGPQDYLMFPQKYDYQVMDLFEQYGWNGFVKRWVEGKFDNQLVSSLQIAKNAQKNIIKNLTDTRPPSIQVYVNHDIIMIPMMYHWFGVLHEYGWVGLLDGFVIQLYSDHMVYIDKEGKNKVPYPSWWNP